MEHEQICNNEICSLSMIPPLYEQVYLVREISAGDIYAMKVLRKDNIIQRNQVRLRDSFAGPAPVEVYILNWRAQKMP